jgi:uncharacterized cupin superfamily protein
VAHPNLVHWDDIDPGRREAGEIGGTWTNLGRAARSVNAGVNRIQVDPGKRSTPLHAHGAEEEIFYVLGGSGLLYQGGKTCAVAAGDCIVHRAGTAHHTLRAGEDGLDVLAFGERIGVEVAHLPRARVVWAHPAWVEDSPGEHPDAREAAAGPLEFPEPGERFRNVAARAEVEGVERVHGTHARVRYDLASAAGSRRTGLKLTEIRPGMRSAPLHCHSAEEEIFVVLEGEGIVELGAAEPVEEHPVRAGHVLARPAGTGISHCFRAGEGGMTVLMYGTRDPNDICFYPRSNKVSLRGVGVIARLEHLDYWDGEP